MGDYCVYMHINKVNGKRYIGITKRNPIERWGHDGCNYKTSPHFYSAIQKYGWDNFFHEILFTNLTKHEACVREIILIRQYHTQDRRFGYNVTEGGDAPAMPDEIRKMMSEKMIGNKNGLGHPCSEEKKKKIRDSQKGRPFTDEHKKRLSEAARKRQSPPCSDEKRRLLSERYPHEKLVYCVETDTVYESVQECARQLHLYATNVAKVCKGIHKTTGGYHFQYFDDMTNA